MAKLNVSPMKETKVTIHWNQKEGVYRAKAVGLADVFADGSDRLSALYTLERMLVIVGKYAACE